MRWLNLPVFILGFSSSGPGADPHVFARRDMVENQLCQRGIQDERIVQAFLKVPRQVFIPPDNRFLAYADQPVSIGFGQTISQPYIAAYMTQALELKSGDKVLEIGTGSGYQTAILAELVQDVYSLEIHKDLVAKAQGCFLGLGYRNIQSRQGDGFEGWSSVAPFDAIIVTAAPEQIPENLVKQLKVGGRMILPVGQFSQELVLLTKTALGLEKKVLLSVRFVPMVPGSGEAL